MLCMSQPWGMTHRKNSCCRLAIRHYTAKVKFGSLAKILAMAAALLVTGTGCGSIYATQSVSPLMFLLPGLAGTKPALPQPPAPGRTETSLTLAQVD